MKSIIFYRLKIFMHIFLPASCILLVFASNISSSWAAPVNYSPLVNINSSWEYRWGNTDDDEQEVHLWALEQYGTPGWQEYEYPEKPYNTHFYKCFWLRTKLPQGQWPYPCLYIEVEDQDFGVYLDGRLIYTFGNINSNETKKEPGSRWHIISLGSNFQGKTLTLHMHSNHVAKLGVFYNARIGSYQDNMSIIVKHGIGYIALSAILVFIGASMISLFFIRKINQKSILYLGFFTICSGVCVSTLSGLYELYLDNSTVILCIYTFSLYLIPVGILLFFNQILENGKNLIINVLTIIHIAYAVIVPAASMLNLSPASLFGLPAFLVLLIITMITLTLITTKWAVEGNLETKIFVLGLTLLSIFGIYDIIGGYFKLIIWNHNATTIGMFMFTAVLVYVAAMHFTTLNNKLTQYSEEIQTKDAKLTEAIETDKIRTEYFLSMSHELRTPLSILLGTLQLLKLYMDEGLAKDSKSNVMKHISTMQQNCYRLLKLVNNIIDIMKIDSNYLDLKLENCDIINLVEDVTLSAADYTHSKGLSLCFDTDIEEKVIACDPDKIERVILNLLSNAIKFTKSGGNISVTVHSGTNEVYISVKDDGIGIPRNKLDSIFGKFVQVDNLLTRTHEGSGLGLSITKSIIEMHNGSISAKSEFGKGSEFIIKLPDKIIDDGKVHEENGLLHQNHSDKLSIEFSDI